METRSIELKIGNTKIIVHSKSEVILKSPEEQKAYFLHLQNAGDPVICDIADKVTDLYHKQRQRESHLQTG